LNVPIGETIIRLSTGPFGDFQMPACARLLQTRGITENWMTLITDSDVRRILRRYKEHVTYWNTPRQTTLNELSLFNSALTTLGLFYGWEAILGWFDTLPATRAAPNELV
jgi:hypothetical protein